MYTWIEVNALAEIIVCLDYNGKDGEVNIKFFFSIFIEKKERKKKTLQNVPDPNFNPQHDL